MLQRGYWWAIWFCADESSREDTGDTAVKATAHTAISMESGIAGAALGEKAVAGGVVGSMAFIWLVLG